MSGITTTGSTIISNLDEILPKGIIIMESYTSMARGNWYNCYGNHSNANNECWWNAII